ncbi:hypothetical protein FBQ95_17265 [Chloroflexi bacterium CFX3]|nr:hypothetical protein [Chloroflexi bacterium CFX3]
MKGTTRIYWQDGPTVKAVAAVAKQYEGGYFDVNQDLYVTETKRHPETGELVQFGVQYIFCDRRISVAFMTRIAEQVCKQFGVAMPTITDNTTRGAYIASDFELVREIDRLIANTDATSVEKTTKSLTAVRASERIKQTTADNSAVEVETVVWYVSGNTYPHRATFKAAGGRWRADLKNWRFEMESLPPNIQQLLADQPIEKVEANQGRAEHLRGLATALTKQIQEKRRVPDWNMTRRRAAMQENRESEARRLEMVQDKLNALADAWERAEVQGVLGRISTRKQVEVLLSRNGWDNDLMTCVRLNIASKDEFLAVQNALKALGNPEAGCVSRADELRILEREVMIREIEGFYPTPTKVIAQMLHLANLQPDLRVLEPSAGRGDIADAIKSAHPSVRMDVIEINPMLCGVLKFKGYQPVADDFLDYAGGGYDRILANPPFERFQDATHIQHMYTLLAQGGRLVSVCSEAPFFRRDKAAQAFRAWLKHVQGLSMKLPDGSFMESARATGVATRLVIVDKG